MVCDYDARKYIKSTIKKVWSTEISVTYKKLYSERYKHEHPQIHNKNWYQVEIRYKYFSLKNFIPMQYCNALFNITYTYILPIQKLIPLVEIFQISTKNCNFKVNEENQVGIAKEWHIVKWFGA